MDLANTTVRSIRLVHPPGRGGMGEVQLGHEDALDRDVTVEALGPSDS